MLGRFGDGPAGLFDDGFLDVAELVLAEEHFRSDEEGGRAKGAAVDRVGRQIDQPFLDVVLLRPRDQALETERFIRRHNITTFRQNPFFPVNTLMLMRGAVAAQFEGVFEPYFRAAYHHMWEEPKKMDDLETFRSAFIASGIDIDRLIARAQQDDVKKGLIDRTSDAVNRGAFGSPTFFVGTEMFFGKDQLRDVEASIVEQTSQPVSKTA